MLKKSLMACAMMVAVACSGHATKTDNTEQKSEPTAEVQETPQAQQVNSSRDITISVGSTWHNGFEFYNVRKDGDVFAFTGGTLHEGGTCFGLKPMGKGMYRIVAVKWSPDTDDYEGNEPYVSTIGVEYDNFSQYTGEAKNVDGQDCIILRNGKKEVVSVLLPVRNDGGLRDVIETDMARYLAGNYRTNNGERYILGTDQSYSFNNRRGKYTFEEEYDMPTDVMTLTDGSHLMFKAEGDNIVLYNATHDSESDTWTKGAVHANLTRMVEDMEHWRYEFASQQLLTVNMLAQYSQQQLRQMRNEIWARHGYTFSSNDLQQIFSRVKEYRPVGDNSKVKLSDLEAINVSLIKSVEEKP